MEMSRFILHPGFNEAETSRRGAVALLRYDLAVKRNEPLVNKTPCPSFAGLKRREDGMSIFMKVFCRVFVLRGVAAADVSAR